MQRQRRTRATFLLMLSFVCGSALADPVSNFVSAITRWDGDNIARWHAPLCPTVAGVSAEQAGYLRARILEVAAAVRAPAAIEQQCEGNLLIVLTEHPDQIWAAWRARYPKLFSRESRQNIERIVDVTRPVSTLQNATGEAVGKSSINRDDPGQGHRMSDSRFRKGSAEDIYSVLVVVNTSATGTATFGQLADYIAMVSLARVDPRLDPSADLADAPTILKVFAKDSTGAPQQLTKWDQGFLKGLYQGGDALTRKRADIAKSMRDEIAL